MVVCGVGAAHVEHSSGSPSGVLDDRSVRTSLANLTAPSRLISPAPCSKLLKPASGCAVYMRIALIRLGVNFGLACKSKAAAPATTGVAIEVPLKYICLLEGEPLTLASRFGLLVTR